MRGLRQYSKSGNHQSPLPPVFDVSDKDFPIKSCEFVYRTCQSKVVNSVYRTFQIRRYNAGQAAWWECSVTQRKWEDVLSPP
ncbi:hypothetical protein J6590_014021 [Homalodisca vitripennis]|nr:hypothetical protein J6590_014021 [Homalodisca vitripennis]